MRHTLRGTGRKPWSLWAVMPCPTCSMAGPRRDFWDRVRPERGDPRWRVTQSSGGRAHRRWPGPSEHARGCVQAARPWGQLARHAVFPCGSPRRGSSSPVPPSPHPSWLVPHQALRAPSQGLSSLCPPFQAHGQPPYVGLSSPATVSCHRSLPPGLPSARPPSRQEARISF